MNIKPLILSGFFLWLDGSLASQNTQGGDQCNGKRKRNQSALTDFILQLSRVKRKLPK
ncbi:hypothetical protein [Paenibacillus pinihumi]|uniref:hypothetical protein n=1 Tax=Paenibacillus pinihumi TaxID=669462 RepID=UPI0004014878|nr:hypothetical protein [Paenibacillus pinihumi]